MNLLPMKDVNKITDASHQVNYGVKPGRLMFFNSYLPHMYTVDSAYEPFRFIHFNVQAIHNVFMKGLKKMSKKNKIIHLPKLHNTMGPSHNAYIKAMLAHPKKYPADFVETLLEERKKQLMKEKNVQKDKV